MKTVQPTSKNKDKSEELLPRYELGKTLRTQFYLRRVGAPIGGLTPYMYTNALATKRGVVFASTRTMAKAQVWRIYPNARFYS